jgi:hypothetical protein
MPPPHEDKEPHMRRTRISVVTAALAAAAVAALGASASTPAAAPDKPRSSKPGKGWRSLWNGKSLDGWETFLRGAEKGAPPIGAGKDPNGVFSIVKVDGKPAIRISGQDWGALTTREDFENYHLRLEFKWGEKRWPPRENAKRDSGILYHCVGPHGAGSGAWMRSFESQIQEGDCGDFHSVDGVIVDVDAVPAPEVKNALLHRPGAPLVQGTRSRIIKNGEHERPTGAWNVMEVLAVGQTAVHLVNGKVVMVLKNLRHKVDGKEIPLTSGKIQIQSEGAEVYYRNIELRPLAAIPPAYL